MLNRRHSAHHCLNDSEPPIATVPSIPKTATRKKKKEPKINYLKHLRRKKFKYHKQYQARERYGLSESKHSLVFLVYLFVFTFLWKRHTRKHTYVVIMLMENEWFTAERSLYKMQNAASCCLHAHWKRQVIEHSLSSGEYNFFFFSPINRRKTPLLTPQFFFNWRTCKRPIVQDDYILCIHTRKILVENFVNSINLTVYNVHL